MGTSKLHLSPRLNTPFQTEVNLSNLKVDVIRRKILHIAIFGYMHDGNLTDPKPNRNQSILSYESNSSPM